MARSWGGLLLLVAALTACDGAGTAALQQEFPDRAAALEAGAIVEGRLPALLPESAVEIKEHHALQTNELWVHFRYDGADLSSIDPYCEEVPSLSVVHPKISRTERIGWWNPHLRIASSQGLDDYRMFRCHKQTPGIRKPYAYLAVDRDAARAWYWELRHEPAE